MTDATVVVTVEAALPAADAFVRLLLDRGAFVVRAGMGMIGDHLHHFPLRAATDPRRGRLVCVDLADYLYTWRPGSVADLHVIPSDFDRAVQVLRRVSVPGRGVRALNLGFHFDLGAPGDHLAAMDRLAEHCRERYLEPEGDMVFTDMDRMDGRIGSADLLIVHDGKGTGG